MHTEVTLETMFFVENVSIVILEVHEEATKSRTKQLSVHLFALYPTVLRAQDSNDEVKR